MTEQGGETTNRTVPIVGWFRRPDIAQLRQAALVVLVASVTLPALSVPGATATEAGEGWSGSVPGAVAQATAFDDLASGGVHAPQIEALDRLGVFEGTGCGEGRFCPGEPLERWVMAVWLVRLLGERPVRGSGSRFGDMDAGVWWVSYVERFDDLGITVGCDAGPPRRYCPHDFVTRAQMATFLARAFDLASGGVEAGFADVSGGVHAPRIDALAAAGITAGCAVEPRRYCPDDFVTRGQMATLLKRARTAFIGPCPAESDDSASGSGGGLSGSGGGLSGSGGGSSGPTRPPAGVPSPAAPQSVVVDPDAASLTVTWSPPAFDGDIAGYRLQWKGPGEEYSDTERWDSTTHFSYEITDLVNGAEYFVRVAAGFRAEVSGFGDWAEGSGVPHTAPDAPGSLRVVAGDERLTVRWRAPANNGGSVITGYRVEWSSDGVPVGEDDTTGLGYEIEDLANGVDYVARVAAVNSAGAGVWSEGAGDVPVGPPDAPRAVGVEPANGSVMVTWEAPADDGSSAVTGYVVQWRTDRQGFGPSRERRFGADILEYEITGLVNGTEYFVRVAAVNDIADGEPSPGVPVVPATTPGLPRDLRVEPGDGLVKVTWQAADDGGSPIAGYVVQWRTDDQGFGPSRERRFGADILEYEITGLVNGTEYFVRVAVVNDVGDGEPSPEVSVVPAKTPGVPTDVGADRGDGSVTVSWGASGDGGSAISGYRVQWRSDDDRFADSDFQATVYGGLSRRITDLPNGVVYFTRVRATNDVGDGPWSASTSATPARVAGPPRSVGAVAAPAMVTVTWQAPADNGGAPITGYKVQWRPENEGYADPGRQATVTDLTDLSYEIGGLTNGTRYIVRVAAVNSIGDGGVSPETSATPSTTPAAPRNVAAEPGDRSVTASWEVADDGGVPITRYLVQWRTNSGTFGTGRQRTAGGDASSYRITGLTNGTAYWVRVAAVNSVDVGPWSSVGSAFAATVPSPPRSVGAVAAPAMVTVTWQASDDGGSLAITGYKVQWRAEDQTYDEASRQAVVTDLADLSYEIGGLANGTQYYVQVLAMNDVGDSPASTQRSATPATVPGAPGDVTLEVRDSSLGVSWTAPDDGGSAITGYRVQWRAGNGDFEDSDPRETARGTAYRITGLINGAEYWVRVAAVNGVDVGPWSPVGSAFAATVPGAPQSVTVDPADGSITLSWQASDDGGSAITEYRVQWKGPDQEYNETDRQATVTNPGHQITGLINGAEYWVRVAAMNAAGTGAAAMASGVPRAVPGLPGVPSIHATHGILLISWDPPESDGGLPVTEYLVQWKGPGQEYNETDRQATVTSPRHQVTSLEYGEYFVRVWAVSEAGAGPKVEASIFVGSPPGAPQSPVVATHSSYLAVSWDPPENDGDSPITGYQVLWKGPDQEYDDSPCSFRRITVSPDGDLETVIGPLENATTYDIRIVASNDSGPGETLDLSGTPMAIPNPPVALDAFSIDGGLWVEWDAPWDGGSPITGYRVQWKGPGEDYDDTRRVVVTGLSDPSHEITGLTNGTEYQVRAVAVNAISDSRISETTGSPGNAPGRPRSPATAAVEIIESHRWGILVTWEAPTDTGGSAITGYRVQWKRDFSTGYNTGGVVGPGPSPSYRLEVLCTERSNCRRYQFVFRISALNSDGAGPPAETSGLLTR